MKEEVENTLDILEAWVTDENAKADIVAAFPDQMERSVVAHRLLDAAVALEELALAIWPPSSEPQP